MVGLQSFLPYNLRSACYKKKKEKKDANTDVVAANEARYSEGECSLSGEFITRIITVFEVDSNEGAQYQHKHLCQC